MDLNLKALDKINSYERVGVACSGGLDSSVLIDILCQNIEKSRIYLIHVNHKINSSSDEWEEFCNAKSKDYGIEFLSFRLEEIDNVTEESLRNLRYKSFSTWATSKDLLCTAHHKDDNLETILFRIFRGTGIRGLKGIPVFRSEENLNIYRPLLQYTRKDIEKYADQKNITWIRDESNLDTKFSRNYIRNEIIPSLKIKWPSLSKSVEYLSMESEEVVELIDEVAFQDLMKCSISDNCISINQLRSFSNHRINNIVNFWIKKITDIQVSKKFLYEAVNEILDKNKPEISKEIFANKKRFRIEKYREDIFLFEDLSHQEKFFKRHLEWATNNSLNLPTGNLLFREVVGEGIAFNKLTKQICISSRTQDIKCKPYGRAKSQRLKKIFQEYGVPYWKRDRLPFIYIKGKLAAVGSLWVCEEFHASSKEKGLKPIWNDYLDT